MRLACDIDGVIADLETPISKEIEGHFGVKPDKNSKGRFYMHDRYGESIDPQVMDEFITDLFNKPEFWESAKPINQNVIALRQASHEDHYISFITGRHEPARQVTQQWLYKWDIPFDCLLMETLQVKHRAMLYTGSELLIEDRYSEAVTVAQQGFRSYLVRTSYNVSYEGKSDDGVVWVDDINEVLAIEGIAQRNSFESL